MKYKPYQHQQKAIDLFKENKGILACYLAPGLGKTFTTIECFKFIKKYQPHAKLIVTCPLSLIVYDSWADDIKKFSDFKVQDLHANLSKIDNDADIYLTNFEMFRSKIKLEAIRGFMINHIIMWAIDESSFLKSASALQTKRILSLRGYARYKMCLSGTPAPNTPLEFWAQITFLKDGVLPSTFTAFKNEYAQYSRGDQTIPNEFLSALNDMDVKRQVINLMFPNVSPSKRKILMASNFRAMLMKINQSGFKPAVSEEQTAILLEKIKPFTIFVKKSDCTDVDFTKQSIIPKFIKMNKKQQSVYNEMKRHMIIEINNEPIVANMALKKILKLRQITSGFVYGEESKHMLSENAKLEALKYDINRLGNAQIIIWCNFTYEIEMIQKFLGDACGCVYGGVKKSEKQKTIEDYKLGKVQYLVANTQSISHGLTFLNSHYQIFYSVNDSYERMAQAKDRDHRLNQLKDCTYYYYLCKGTIDELIWENISNKESAEQFVHKFLNS